MWSMPKSEQCNYVLTCVGTTTDLQCSHAAAIRGLSLLRVWMGAYKGFSVMFE
jgi:hypothetical protein